MGRTTLPSMESQLEQSVILITGASAGIGTEFARQLAQPAKTLVLVARRKERLDALKTELEAKHSGLRVFVEPCDLADGTARLSMLDRVQDAVGTVDVLVNNAGLGTFGRFVEADWEKTEQVLRVNIDALVHLTHRLLPAMIAQGRGGVLNVSSGLGLQFMPGLASYVGTKHFVTGFTESLRLEVAGTGVVVSQLCPGPVTTEFGEVAEMKAADASSPLVLTAAQAAREGIAGFERNKALIVPGAMMRAAMAIGSLVPRPMSRALISPLARRLDSPN